MDHALIRESALEALDAIGRSMGMTIDLGDALRALGEAERAIPGSWAETWAARLERAGAAIGLRIERTDRPAAEILTRSYPLTPLIGYVEVDDGPRWVVVTAYQSGRIRYAIYNDPERRDKPVERWADAENLERMLGPDSGWAMVQPLAPLEGMRGDQTEEKSPEPIKPLSRLFSLLKPEGKDIWAIVIFTLAIAGLSLAPPLAVERLVVTVSLGTTYQQVVSLSVMLFLALMFGVLFRIIRYYMMEIVQRRIYVRIVSDISYRLPRSRLEAFDAHQYGPELVNRFFEFTQIQKMTSMLFLDALTLIVQVIIGMVLLAFYHPYLLAFDVVIVAFGLWIVFVSGRGAIRTAIAESHAKYESADWLEEISRHPLAFRNRGGPELAREGADSVARHWLRARRSHFQVVFNQIINAHILSVVAGTAMLALGGWLVIGGELTLGQLVAAELLVVVAGSSLVHLAKYFEGFYDLMAAMEKLGYLTDLPLKDQGGEQHRVDEGRGAGLAVREVSYHYDDHGHGLPAFDLDAKPGEFIALIGPDASGRSTLADLLGGLREPTEGRIFYDGGDLRDVHPAQHRDEIALVRDPEIFKGSLVENVRMGRESVSLDDVHEALDRVGLLQELKELPNGMRTELGTGGRPLSEGQARRLTIARALASKPRLLVIDQTLDALDPGPREIVLDAVFNSDEPRTVIVVTHSVDIASRCNRTVPLQGGDDLAESGVEPLPTAAVEPEAGHKPDGGEHGEHRPWYMEGTEEAPAVPPTGKNLPALRLVQSIGPMRRLSAALAIALVVAPIFLAITPWRQHIPGRGRVIAYNPQDRQQPIKAPIHGRVMRWWVVEGSKVKRGDRIVELEDNDPDYLRRLELLLEASLERARAAEAKASAYGEVVLALVDAQIRAVETAQKQLEMTIQRVEVARQNVEAAQATLAATAPDYERKRRGAAEGLVSVQDFQFAEQAFREARAQVEGRRAEVGAANDEVAARSAELDRVRAETQSRIDASRADLESAQNELGEAQQGVTLAEVDLARQARRLVLAPRDGTIFRVLTGQDTDIVAIGEPIALLVPDYPDPMSRTVELFVDGRDMPLIEPGREVRLQFEGWPAVQFIGWPSVAVGTFPGRVILVDPTDNGRGSFRVLVGPPPGRADVWPSERFLRQGVQVQGWVLLRHVTLGYEIWRLINGFPPYVSMEEPQRSS